MAELLPFRALRPSADRIGSTIAPPYDVMGLDEVRRWRRSDPGNITHVDLALPEDGEQPYVELARRLETWVASGRLLRDEEPTLTIHRMTFTDALGVERTISGVLGALEVTHGDGSTVLAHERTTPKASTDRYDLTVATATNLSPVWGLALGAGLTELLAEPGSNPLDARMDDSAAGSVAHRWEVVDEPGRIAAIREAVARDDVLIADGHHRYGVARRVLEDHSSRLPGADHTLAFISDLTEDQLSVAAIHRVYSGVAADGLRAALIDGYRPTTGGTLAAASQAANLPSQIAEREQPCLITPGGNVEWLEARPESLDCVRDLDGARLEHLLAEVAHEVHYLHDPVEAAELVLTGRRSAAVLIRPVGIAEITRTGRTGELMPPKSTFFSPKLPTGAVLRPLDGR
jgi:uncharacterized protein (DUF1015 family)